MAISREAFIAGPTLLPQVERPQIKPLDRREYMHALTEIRKLRRKGDLTDLDINVHTKRFNLINVMKKADGMDISTYRLLERFRYVENSKVVKKAVALQNEARKKYVGSGGHEIYVLRDVQAEVMDLNVPTKLVDRFQVEPLKSERLTAKDLLLNPTFVKAAGFVVTLGVLGGVAHVLAPNSLASELPNNHLGQDAGKAQPVNHAPAIAHVNPDANGGAIVHNQPGKNNSDKDAKLPPVSKKDDEQKNKGTVVATPGTPTPVEGKKDQSTQPKDKNDKDKDKEDKGTKPVTGDHGQTGPKDGKTGDKNGDITPGHDDGHGDHDDIDRTKTPTPTKTGTPTTTSTPSSTAITPATVTITTTPTATTTAVPTQVTCIPGDIKGNITSENESTNFSGNPVSGIVENVSTNTNCAGNIYLRYYGSHHTQVNDARFIEEQTHIKTFTYHLEAGTNQNFSVTIPPEVMKSYCFFQWDLNKTAEDLTPPRYPNNDDDTFVRGENCETTPPTAVISSPGPENPQPGPGGGGTTPRKTETPVAKLYDLCISPVQRISVTAGDLVHRIRKFIKPTRFDIPGRIVSAMPDTEEVNNMVGAPLSEEKITELVQANDAVYCTPEAHSPVVPAVSTVPPAPDVPGPKPDVPVVPPPPPEVPAITPPKDEVPPPPPPPPAPPTTPSSPPVQLPHGLPNTGEDIYVVGSGDSLWAIAQKEYGDPSMWTAIRAANNIPDPKRLQIGTQLIIPR